MTPTPALLQNPALRSSLRSAATAFLISRGFVLAAVLAAPLLLVQEVSPDLVPPPYHTPAFWVIDALARWDAWRYLSVASIGYREGYLGANPQIFPLYPALMRLLGGWFGDAGLAYAGFFIANGAFFAALTLLHLLVRERYDKAVADRSVLYLAVFPTSFFFSALYAESLFLLLSLGCCYALERHRWVLSGALGGLAALTRAPGVFLVIVLLWEFLRQPGGLRQAKPAQLLSLMVPPAGLLLFMGVLAQQIGDPLGFVRVQTQWGRALELPTGHLTGLIEAVTSGGAQFPTFGLLFPLTLTILFIAVGLKALGGLPSLYRMWFWVYLGVILSAPAGAAFLSVTRFLAVAFPAFIGLARWGDRRWFHLSYLTLSLLFLTFSTILFSRWYWVA